MENTVHQAPLLSILIPVYNVVNYLEACLKSIAGQIFELSGDTKTQIEVLLIDDGSTDGSTERAQSLCAHLGAAFSLRILPCNQGLSAVRTQLLAAARGEYAWFIDSDDYLLPNALAEVVKALHTHAPDLVLIDFKTRKKPHVTTFNGPAGVCLNDTQALVYGVFYQRKLHLWSKIFRRTLWPATLHFPKNGYFEDIATIPWLLLEAGRFVHIAKPLLFYTSRADSIIAQVASVRTGFDEIKNDALASNLLGYAQALERCFGAQLLPETRFVVAHFCAKELRKIAIRLLRVRLSQGRLREGLAAYQRYAHMLEACAPLSFSALAKAYRARRQPIRWLILQALLLLQKISAP